MMGNTKKNIDAIRLALKLQINTDATVPPPNCQEELMNNRFTGSFLLRAIFYYLEEGSFESC